MKTKKKWTIVATASLALILAVAFTVQAGPFGRGKGGGGGFGAHRGGEFGPHRLGMKSEMRGLRHLIDLTEEQEAKIEEIRTEHRNQMQDLRASIRTTRESMRALMDADGFDAEAARAAFREGSSIREEMFVRKAQMMSEIRAVLTDEQRETLKEKRALMHEGRKRHLRERFDNSEE